MRQRNILAFWFPLFASWLLMAAEGPIISAAINRLPDEVIMLAAQGLVMSLSITIESPIINLLATATALVKDRQSFELVRRFTIHWNIVLTIVALLVAYTPLFGWIMVAMNVPAGIATWVQTGMKIMVLWSAAIGWRRFLQGVMIHFGYTRTVAWGTAIRLVASGGTAIGLALFSQQPGIVIGALALMAGVLAEAFYATLAIRPVIHRELAPPPTPSPTPITYQELFWFHLPLAATSLLTLLAQPLVGFSLTRLEQPTESLAAWPLIFQLLLLTRAAAFALPEVVIALGRQPENRPAIRRFSLNLAITTTIIMALLVFTPLIHFYLFTLQDAARVVGGLAQTGIALFLLLPAITVLTSWFRGLLIQQKATRQVNTGMIINLIITAVVLGAGLIWQAAGIPTAAVALNLAALFETFYLLWQSQRLIGLGLPSPFPATLATLPLNIKENL